MASVKLYLDTRRSRKDGTSTLKLAVGAASRTHYINLGIDLRPDQWDGQAVTRLHPLNNRINAILKRKILLAEMALLDCRGVTGREPDLDTAVKYVTGAISADHVQQQKAAPANDDSLTQIFSRWTQMKTGKTKKSYEQTLSRIRAFIGSGKDISIAKVSRTWLIEFDSFLAKTAPSPNARAVYMRNLRAVFNFAIDEGITDNYPFRRFKIKTVKTAKRSMSVEDLHTLLTMAVEPHQQLYRDMFALSFYLMGINFADLMKLPVGADRTGRLEFNRSKTGHLYSMRIEPEAQRLIDKYRGKRLLLSPMDRYADHEDFLRRTNKALNTIGDTRIVSKHGKKECVPLFPGITTYWARHSWATIAASLDIPKETIAAALGHGGNSVTDIYINFDQNKIDAANRRVIDWVLYGRR